MSMYVANDPPQAIILNYKIYFKHKLSSILPTQYSKKAVFTTFIIYIPHIHCPIFRSLSRITPGYKSLTCIVV